MTSLIVNPGLLVTSPRIPYNSELLCVILSYYSYLTGQRKVKEKQGNIRGNNT